MNRFNAKHIVLFIILIIALSALFAEHYSENFPFSLAAIIGYLVTVVTISVVSLLFIQKSLSSTALKTNTYVYTLLMYSVFP
jgi:hypothetical protein